MKKISTVGLLAVVVAMVIILGVIGVSAGDNNSENKITEPDSVINISSNLITDDISNSNGAKPLQTPHPEKAEETEKEGSAIPDWVIPGAIVALIVVLSFLIFFIIWERTEDELFFYAIIFWIAYAMIIPMVLFIVEKLGFVSFGFTLDHMLIAIIAALLLPVVVALVHDHITGKTGKGYGQKGRNRNSRGIYDRFDIEFNLFDKENEQPIKNAKISVTKSGSDSPSYIGPTDPFGECKLKRGNYTYKIMQDGVYKPESGTFSVEGEKTISISLTKRTGNLVVQVKDSETGNPIRGANVNVSGAAKTTDEQGKALFSGLSIGAKEIMVGEITGVYSSGTLTGVIEEDATTETSVPIKSLLHISTDKRNKLKALGSQLQDNYRRVSTYDPCIPFYYKSSVDNMVNLIEGMVGEPMLFVGAKNPGETIGYLVDAVDLASREITEVMTLKRNVDVYSAAMGLEKAEVEAKPVGFGDSRVKDYIRDAGDFYNSYYPTVQSKLFNIDTTITRKTGELNVLPVSGLWRVARTLLNETASSSADSIKKSAMLLIADFILDYADDMLREPQIIERLKIMVL